MYRFKFFIDFEKEEQWLEKMAYDGYHLRSASFGYQFAHGEPEKATIKIDYRKFTRNDDFINYRTLFEDSGWKHIAGTKSSGVQYFKRVDANALEEIFSDKHSKATRYKRYSDMFFALALSYLPLLVVFYLTDIIDFKAFTDPKELYLTPGLWNKTGSSFWFSFLFETPFAFMRGLAWSFIPIMIICYLCFGYKSNKLYVQNKN